MDAFLNGCDLWKIGQNNKSSNWISIESHACVKTIESHKLLLRLALDVVYLFMLYLSLIKLLLFLNGSCIGCANSWIEGSLWWFVTSNNNILNKWTIPTFFIMLLSVGTPCSKHRPYLFKFVNHLEIYGKIMKSDFCHSKTKRLSPSQIPHRLKKYLEVVRDKTRTLPRKSNSKLTSAGFFILWQMNEIKKRLEQ